MGVGSAPRAGAEVWTPIERGTRPPRREGVLDQQAGGAQVEGRLRRAGGRQDESGERDCRVSIEGQSNRVAANVVGAILGGARLGLRSWGGRIARTALARPIGDSEAGSARRDGHRSPGAGRGARHVAAAAVRRGTRGAARMGNVHELRSRTGRRLARHRQHPHDRREDDPGEPGVMARTSHDNLHGKITQLIIGY